MNEIPMWWLLLSGFAFLINAAAFVFLSLGVFRLFGIVRDLQPKIASIATKIELLTERVDHVATNVKGFTDSAKGTMESVGGGASSIVGAISGLTTSSTRRLEKFSPYVMAAIAAFKLISAFRGARAEKRRHDDE